MTHPKARKRMLAIMLGCVALTALFFAGSASAASRGYTLQNKSDKTLELVNASQLPATICNGFICVIPDSIACTNASLPAGPRAALA